MDADPGLDLGSSPAKGSLLGRPAPGFNLPSFMDGSGGGDQSLEDYHGRKVILVFLRHFA